MVTTYLTDKTTGAAEAVSVNILQVANKQTRVMTAYVRLWLLTAAVN